MARGTILKHLTGSLENVTEMGKEATIDRDKFLKLQMDLTSLRATMMMSGKGASVTKVTICAVVLWLVGLGSYGFLVNPMIMPKFQELVRCLTPVIGLLMGFFGAGKMWKNSKFGNGNGN